MEVIIAHEGKETSSGYYHFLNDGKNASLCGSINEASPFASDISLGLSQQLAERQGFNLCGQCANIADQQGEAKPPTEKETQ